MVQTFPLPNRSYNASGGSLAQALQVQGKTDQAGTYQAKFEKVWARTDTKIRSSCLCQEGVTMAK